MAQKEDTDPPIIRQLKRHDRLYADGKPKLTDAEYDALRDAAKRKYPHNSYFQKIGARLTPIKYGKLVRKEEKLPWLMPSLEKKLPKQVIDWLKTLPKDAQFVLSPKWDGIALLLEYKDSVLKAAFTRGDEGVYGFNVTENIRHVPAIPQILTKKIKGTVFVKGELICRQSVFKKYFAKKSGGKYKNARNFVIGIVNTLKRDTTTFKALQKLSFMAFSFHQIKDGKPNYMDQKYQELIQLSALGFTTAPLLDKKEIYLYKDRSKLTLDYLNAKIKEWRDNKNFDVEQDGLVLEISDHKYRKKMDFDESRPKFAFAVKPEAVDQETKIGIIDHIEWNLTSRKLLKPVVILKKKLEFKGVDIERISGHNAAFVLKHKLRPGLKVKIIRSGDVISRLIGTVE